MQLSAHDVSSLFTGLDCRIPMLHGAIQTRNGSGLGFLLRAETEKSRVIGWERTTTPLCDSDHCTINSCDGTVCAPSVM